MCHGNLARAEDERDRSCKDEPNRLCFGMARMAMAQTEGFIPEFHCLTRRVPTNTTRVQYKLQSPPACRFPPGIS